MVIPGLLLLCTGNVLINALLHFNSPVPPLPSPPLPCPPVENFYHKVLLSLSSSPVVVLS